MNRTQLASMIDHTLLKPEATRADVLRICEEAKQYKFASVCVNSCYAETVSQALKGSSVATCCVVGFPLGAMSSEMKAAEAKWCVQHGADEVDMVINVGLAKAGDFEGVEKDVAAVVSAAKGAVVKVIIEACLLTQEEKIAVCRAAARAKADFVKTSTGLSTWGATESDVALMKKASGLRVKAAGGIRSFETAMRMIAAGADRIGASAGIEIINGLEE